MASTLRDALDIVVRTDPGLVRAHNEDAVFVNPGLGFAILADGMGGYNAGEVASSMAAMHLSAGLETALASRQPHEIDKATGRTFAWHCLLDSIGKTNAAIFNAAASESRYAGMGTTLVAGLFYDNRLLVAHIGDSRLYRLRGEEFDVVTRDHSLLQEQIDCGMITPEEASCSQNRNLVTRALGVDTEVETEINEYPVRPGDIYLFCSDGLNDMVSDKEIRETLQLRSNNLDLAATQLIRMANDNGGSDNVSVILVGVLREFPAPRSCWSQFMAWIK